MNEKTELSDEELADLVERVENRVGMGHGAWDMVNPAEIVRAVLAAASPSSKSTKEADKLPEPPSFRTEWGGRVVAWGDALTYGHECFEAGRAALASSSIKEDGERAGLTDKGPWVAEKWPDGRVVLQSDQFAHDVALIVNGDFADDDQRMAYAKGLSAQMNAGVALLSSPPSPLGDTPDQQEQKR